MGFVLLMADAHPPAAGKRLSDSLSLSNNVSAYEYCPANIRMQPLPFFPPVVNT